MIGQKPLKVVAPSVKGGVVHLVVYRTKMQRRIIRILTDKRIINFNLGYNGENLHSIFADSPIVSSFLLLKLLGSE
jgi:hypothetical protein